MRYPHSSAVLTITFPTRQVAYYAQNSPNLQTFQPEQEVRELTCSSPLNAGQRKLNSILMLPLTTYSLNTAQSRLWMYVELLHALVEAVHVAGALLALHRGTFRACRWWRMVLRTKQDDFPRYQVGDMVIKAAGLQSIGLLCPYPLRLRSPFGPVLGSMSNSRMQDRYMRGKLCIPVDTLE